MSVWNKVAIGATGIGLILTILVMLTLGLLWSMPVEMFSIISVIVVQNLIAIGICWFADRNQYSQLKNWLVGYWTVISIMILFLFLFAVLVENMWWWIPTTYALIL